MFGRNKFSLLAGLAAALGTPFGLPQAQRFAVAGEEIPRDVFPEHRPTTRFYRSSPVNRRASSRNIIRAATKMGFGRRSALGRSFRHAPFLAN